MEKEVDFSFIRYANCWEDTDILLQAIMPSKDDKILSIGSGGDNSLALLGNNASIVVAVDINKCQLLLIELKALTIQKFSYEEALTFLGFRPCENRIEYYRSIRKYLSKEAQIFWDGNQGDIKNGIIHMGKFEKYFQLFSKKILPFIHNRQTVSNLFEPKSTNEQHKFFHNIWDTWRWRLIFKIFFSKTVMGRLGRDPQFLKEVNINVAEYILDRASKELSSESAQNNYILKYALQGTFDNVLPPYLNKVSFDKIKKNIEQLKLHHGPINKAFNYYGKFDKMNLSNIFEYMNKDIFIQVGDDIIKNLNKNGRIAYWNLMVPRLLSQYFNKKIIFLKKESLRLTNIDRGFFYQNFIIEEKL